MATLPADPPSLRERLVRFLEQPRFDAFIVAVIVFKAVALGVETVPPVMAAIGPLLVAIDTIAIAIFVVELTLKMTG